MVLPGIVLAPVRIPLPGSGCFVVFPTVSTFHFRPLIPDAYVQTYIDVFAGPEPATFEL